MKQHGGEPRGVSAGTSMLDDGHIYEPLDKSKREIRLLKILNGSEDGPVECRLHTASLDDDISFAALSYVWGDKNITKKILVNGQIKAVSSNLESALRRFRDYAKESGVSAPNPSESQEKSAGLDSRGHPGEYGNQSQGGTKRMNKQDLNEGIRGLSVNNGQSNRSRSQLNKAHTSDQEAVKTANEKGTHDRYLEAISMAAAHYNLVGSGNTFLWVDAVCINQSDLLEKGHQVQIMRDVYSEAKFVISWINPSNNDNTELALRTLREIAPRLGDSKGFQWMQNCPKLCKYDKDSNIPYGNRYWSSLQDFQKSDYFRRIWIVQELFLCRTDTSFFVSGNESLPFMFIYDYFMWACRTWELFPKYYGRPFFIDTHLWTWMVSAPPDLSQLENHLLRPTMKAIIESDKSCDSLTLDSWRFKLNAFIKICQGCHCSDPRDKVFGLLCVFPMDIIPDYDRPVEDVFADWAISSYWNVPLEMLLRLSGVGTRPKSKAYQNLPSWVPDLGSLTERSFALASKDSYLDKSSRLPIPTRFFPTVSRNSGISCFGLYDSEVSEIISRSTWNGLSGIQAGHRVVEYLVSNISRLEGAPYPRGGSQFKAFLKTVARVCPISLDSYTRTMEKFPSSSYLDEIPSSILLGNLLFCLEHVLSSTSKRWIYDLKEMNFARWGELWCILWNLRVDNGDPTPKNILIPRYLPIPINAVKAIRHYTIFYTTNGLIGAGAVGTEVGDKVCLIRGFQEPTLLREIDGKIVNVGECYVHGISNDEIHKIFDQREEEIREINIV
ncbi:heterokaryon incompatibility protein-domain-containing protein [Annulohypoxylon nitens]|nr:heterokaryon incompatibility protein-domain-containing protein [Annulohypoxylon nitens]